MSHSQFRGQPGNQPGGPLPPQPRESWPRRHKFLTSLAVIASLSILAGVVIAVRGGGGQRAAATGAAASRPATEPTVTPVSPVITSSAAARSSRSSSSAPTTRSSGAAASLAVQPNTVTTYTGSGIETTPTFTTTATWQLAYSFNCSEFGEPVKIQVDEGSGSDSVRVLLSETTLKTDGSTLLYDNAGAHYLKVNSPCSWSVKVVDKS